MKIAHYDSIIIGFGKGGKTLAKDLADKGNKVALIEKSPDMYGGTCINIGCIPTKSLIHNAKLALARTDWSFEQKSAFYKKAIEDKNALVRELNRKSYDLLAGNDLVDIITGEAYFISSKEVEVQIQDNELVRFSADKIFINTGAKEIIPKIKGVGNKRVFTSSTLLNHNNLPHILCIVGGGYIGLEFASAYASFGSKVFVLEYNDQLIKREDRDIAEFVQKRLEKLGVEFIFAADIEEIRLSGDQNILIYKEMGKITRKEIRCDAILLAVGRRPNTENLKVEAACLELTERGGIKTDEYLCTSQSNIWAMGDVVGNEQFTYVSMDDSRIVMDQLFGDKRRRTSDRDPLPYAVFIDPPFCRVGMSEKEAEMSGLNYVIAKLEASEIPRAKLLNETDGFLKTIVNKEDGTILGCVLFCTDSHELINIVSSAIHLKIPYTFLRDFVFTHPTMSEALNNLYNKVDMKIC